ncbi:MAG: hypothetical protein J0I21_02240 [Alphaproteobacteria bacterium]|nr:hypothetical protein [Alphaproteobacteria bacterium]
MSESARSLFDELNVELAEIEVYDFITRDSGLQRSACERAAVLLKRLGQLKRDAVADNDEWLANVLLGYECAVTFVRSSISMWILLKAERPDDAWDELVNAQLAVADAVRADKGFERLSIHADRLQFVEEALFPRQVFTSLGIVVKSRKCSICGEEYGECHHVVGRPYMGEICYTRIVELERLDHLSFVSNPANKRTRIREFSDGGGRRNRMTWKVHPHREGTEEPEPSPSE